MDKQKPESDKTITTGKVAVGHPVDVATGTLFHLFDDYALPGQYALSLRRRYSTALLDSAEPGMFGRGWSTPFEVQLRLDANGCQYLDETGESEIVFPRPESGWEPGSRILNSGSYADLSATDTEFCVTRWDPDTGEITKDFFTRDKTSERLKICRRENAEGCAIEFSYSLKTGLLHRVMQQREQRGLELLYDQHSRLVQVKRVSKIGKASNKKAAEKPWLRYSYNQQGMLQCFTDPLGKQAHYKYDSAGRMTNELTLAGKEWRFVFDEQGRCVVTTARNRFDYHRLDYGSEGQAITRVEDSDGHVTQYHYNAAGQVTQEVSPLGHVSKTLFDPAGRVVQEISAAGNAITYEYDEAGNRSGILSPDGTSVHYTFNAEHQPTSLTDPLGNQWTREYDDAGRLVRQVNPEGAEDRYVYDGRGQLIAHVDAEKNQREFAWDASANLVEASDWQGNRSRYQWDEFGGLSTYTDPLSNVTRIERDLLGRLQRVQLSDGHERRYEWDVFDNLTRFTDELDRTTRWQYCDCGNLEVEERADGSRINYGWNAIPGQLAALTNQKSEVFHFSYDAGGRLIEEQDFSGAITSYDYDADDRVIKTTKPSGKTIEYQYNLAGQVVRISYASGDETNFEYDARGLLLKADNGQCPVSFEYDALGRLINEKQGDRAVWNTYNLLNQRISRHTYREDVTEFGWNANGQIDRIAPTGFSAVSFGYDARGFEQSRSFESLVLNSVVDARGRLASQMLKKGNNTPVIERNYQYDAAGNLSRKQDNQWGSTQYVYDQLDRITETLHPGKLKEGFAYDAADNISAQTQQQTNATDTTIDQTRHIGKGSRVEQSRNVKFDYDADGQLIARHSSEGTSLYTWNDASELIAFENPQGEQWQYRYDALGRRVAKVGPRTSHHYHWDGDVVLYEFKIEDDVQSVEQWEYHPSDFSPLFKLQQHKQYLCLNDQIGTPLELVDRDATISWSQRLSTWGDTIDRAADKVSCPIRFQGQWYDEESGLCYNRFRYYSSELGGFVSDDPVGLLGGINSRNYAANATAWVDPYGLSDEGKGKGGGCSITRRPSGFRKKTVKDSWDNAADGSKPEVKQCPTCGIDVEGNPHIGEKRNGPNGWDNDHQPKWKDRDLSGMDRNQVLDNFNELTRLRCRSCNRADN